jgi:hypothetical protein
VTPPSLFFLGVEFDPAMGSRGFADRVLSPDTMRLCRSVCSENYFRAALCLLQKTLLLCSQWRQKFATAAENLLCNVFRYDYRRTFHTLMYSYTDYWRVRGTELSACVATSWHTAQHRDLTMAR